MRPPSPACGLLAPFAVALAMVAGSAGAFEPAEPSSDVTLSVAIDQSEQSGEAHATIRIHARRETVWAVLTSCADAVRIVPKLVLCEVREVAADQSWEKIGQVMEYSPLLPKVSYVVRASYSKPEHMEFEWIAGDPMTLRGSWTLHQDGEFTVAQYEFEFAPGFWLPHWILRAAMRHDLQKMLRALRARAEAVQLATAE